MKDDAELGLFEVRREAGTFDVRGRVVLVERDLDRDDAQDRRGPGRRSTEGAQDAQAPAWWVLEAERVVLGLVRSGHQVSCDTLHEKYPGEPSASGAAFGALFQRLAARGLIVEVGMTRSVRPEARRRRVILWGAP